MANIVEAGMGLEGSNSVVIYFSSHSLLCVRMTMKTMLVEEDEGDTEAT